ncbi:MAG: leucine-rich repeat domain-containing protein, partial [Alistipes sp.]|nr:leucine-rich repeat domain-containing protein [Alistipes sp.]
ISFTIPISVTEIGSRAFFNCRSLTNITFVNGGKITLIKEETFCDCESLTKIAIPKTVTEIEYRAFFSCSSLSSVTIPDNVTKMGEAVFHNCSELKTVNIGEGITAIQDFAFDGCGNLTNVRIGSNVASIGRNAFYSCTKLTSVYCKPVTPPSIYYWFGENAEGDTFFYGSFPMSQELKIYVPMSSYDAYISPQNGDDWDYSELSVKNWTAYASNIVPYNF